MVNASLLSERSRLRNLAWRSYWLFLFHHFFPVNKPFTKKNYLSVSCVKKKKSSGVIKHLFQWIALELTISGRFVKEKPRRLSLNRIVKEEP